MGFASFSYTKQADLETHLSQLVFDVSEANNGSTYTNLSEALSAVPENIRKGGMTIKFIQLTPATYSVVKTEGITEQPAGTEIQDSLVIESGTYTAEQLPVEAPVTTVTYWIAVTETVDEEEVTTFTTWVITKATNDSQEYVQYRLMSTNWSTAVGDWQGVDDEPVAGSDNLVTSGGVIGNVFCRKGLTIRDGIIGSTTTEGAVITDYIDISNLDVIKLNGRSSNIVSAYAFYDENKIYIEGTAVGGIENNKKNITITKSEFPANAKYIVVNGGNSTDSFCGMTISSIAQDVVKTRDEILSKIKSDLDDVDNLHIPTTKAVKDYTDLTVGTLDVPKMVLTRGDIKSQDILILEKPDNVSFFVENYSYYESCVEELYILTGETNISLKCFNNNLYVRPIIGNSEYAWQVVMNTATLKNNEIVELKITTAGSNEDYAVGDTVGYIIFEDIVTFKEYSVGNTVKTLVDGVATNIINSPKISQYIEYFHCPYIYGNDMILPYNLHNPNIDEIENNLVHFDVNACTLEKDSVIMQETVILEKPSVDYFLQDFSYYEPCVDEIYIVPGNTNIVFKYYSGRLFVRPKDGSNYKWQSILYTSSLIENKIIELKVTAVGTDEAYSIGDTVGYVIFKDIETFIAHSYASNHATLDSSIVTNINNSPKIKIELGYYSNIPVIWGTTLNLPFVLKNPTTDELKEKYEEIESQIDGLKINSINILFIGNSYTANSVSYVPFILKNICPNLKFKIGVLFLDGGSLAEHLANILNEDVVDEGGTTQSPQNYNRYSYITEEMQCWSHIATNVTIFTGLDDAHWDIISTHQANRHAAGSWETKYAPYIFALHKAIADYLDYVFKFGWDIIHGSNSNGYSGDKAKFLSIASNSELVEDNTCTEIIFPYGTAVENLRTIETMQLLGDDENHNLLKDGSHLQSGIGQLAASYAIAIKLAEQIGCISKVIAEKTYPTTDWVNSISTIRGADIGTGSIGVTEHNCFLAQVAAIQAVKKPYEVTDINDYDINGNDAGS